ncbi:hypothetical protein HN371_16295 [Candidatus Poribacteria bacterium]|jgi:HEAT repeat protein|nr:hypothetical protein [Candidatus Poribacteria bacterium]MBT7097746.1 hypothetical protein [Candidatus Poribacteria bacterium]MBT7808250.1 hypothetical protein [Candidatus Poribacteria bacterium]
MKARAALAALSVFLMASAALMAQDGIEDVGRAVNFQLSRMTALNPMTRARASDELRAYAARPDGAEHVRGKLDQILPLLEDALPVVRWNAAVMTATLGDSEQAALAYDVLHADAASEDYSIRLGLVDAVTAIGPTPEVIALLEDLAQNDDDEEVRGVAEEALWNIERAPPEESPDDDWGFDPVEFFGGGDDDEDGGDGEPREVMLTGQQAADRIASVVRRFPQLDAIETASQLTNWRRDMDFDGDRRPVSEFLAPGVPRLVEFIRSEPAPPARYLRYAARVLGVAGDEAFEALVVALEDERGYTREAAAFGLLWSITTQDGRLDEESRYRDAAAALVFSLTDEVPAVRAHAAVALGRAALPTYGRDLAFALEDEDCRVSLAAAQALTSLEDGARAEDTQSARERLAAASQSEDEATTLRVLEAAVWRGDDAHEARAMSLLLTDAPAMAFIAGHYLREEGGPDARAALRSAREDERPWVRHAAGARVPTNGAAPAHEAGLHGKVVRGEGWGYFSPLDAEMPLAGALLTYEGPTAGAATTDALGRFHVPGLPAGRYNVGVAADGHLADAFVVVIPDEHDEGAGEEARPTVVRLHRHY